MLMAVAYLSYFMSIIGVIFIMIIQSPSVMLMALWIVFATFTMWLSTITIRVEQRTHPPWREVTVFRQVRVRYGLPKHLNNIAEVRLSDLF